MRGTIIEFSTASAGQHCATVQTDYGVLNGVWDGEIPGLGATVFFEVEFDPDQTTSVGGHVDFAATSPYPNEVSLVGIVEGWIDGVLDLRVGTSIIRVDLPFAPPHGGWLAVNGRQLRLFDTNL